MSLRPGPIDNCRHEIGWFELAPCAEYAINVSQTHGVMAGVRLCGLYHHDDDCKRLSTIAVLARRHAKSLPHDCFRTPPHI